MLPLSRGRYNMNAPLFGGSAISRRLEEETASENPVLLVVPRALVISITPPSRLQERVMFSCTS